MRNLVLSMLSKTLKSFKSLVMLLCSFSLLLSSCDKEVPGTNSGEPVAIFFSVNGDSFGAAEEITRSSETVEPETVVIPVEGGWYMYATLEPDASDTRATNGGANALVAGTEVRILAYLNDGASPAAQAVYTVDPGGTTLSSASPLTVAPGNYTFVAYAKQNSTLSGLGALATLDPAANDLLWGKADNAGAPITVTASTTININISHLCSRIKAVITNTDGTTAYAMLTPAGTMDGYTIDLSTGKPVKNTPATAYPLAGWVGSGASSNRIWTSNDQCLIYTDGEAAKMNLTNININGTAISNRTVEFDKPLKKNTPYTLTVIFKKLPPGGGEPPVGVTTYVGAFWRATETGERIIYLRNMNANIANQGAWTATVAWYDARWNPAAGDGIVFSTDDLDATSLANRGITWNFATENPQTAESAASKITDGKTSVTGTVNASNPHIIFRIGLQQNFAAYNNTSPNWTTTFPARYAVVVLSYNNNTKTQKIFIRQGEGDDYAPGQSSGATWSVFNVSTVGNVVQYPTQAGYFYQWHYDLVINTPKPIHPINPLGAVAGWGTVNVANLYALAGACPAGYAVPTGTVGSQAYQLVANTKTVVGYYADGWFDRRALNSTALVGLVNIAVSVDPSVPTNPRNTDVAYIGALLFNETTNKSLFWPRSGMRRDIDGVLMSPGGFTSYWTSARQMGVGGVDIQVLLSSSQSVDIDGTSPGVNNGGMVRCVRTGAPLDLVDGVSSNPWGTPDADGTDKWVNW